MSGAMSGPWATGQPMASSHARAACSTTDSVKALIASQGLEPAPDDAGHQSAPSSEKVRIRHRLPVLRQRVQLMHALPVIRRKAPAKLRYVVTGRCVADGDVLRPLEQRKVGDLVDDLEIRRTLRFQPSAREQMMALEGLFCRTERRVQEIINLLVREEYWGGQAVLRGVEGEQLRASCRRAFKRRGQ